MQRQTLGMTQRRLGTALGLKFQQVQNYEKGRNRIGQAACTKSPAFCK